ncbi:unnamed protein product, partial [Discosporangium mesarthrocarpum]
MSLIAREQEQVLAPELLASLMASGKDMEGKDHAVFWDALSRLEEVTRAEAMLNIALRGKCVFQTRAGPIGRALASALASVRAELNTHGRRHPFSDTGDDSDGIGEVRASATRGVEEMLEEE